MDRIINIYLRIKNNNYKVIIKFKEYIYHFSIRSADFGSIYIYLQYKNSINDQYKNVLICNLIK